MLVLTSSVLGENKGRNHSRSSWSRFDCKESVSVFIDLVSFLPIETEPLNDTNTSKETVSVSFVSVGNGLAVGLLK